MGGCTREDFILTAVGGMAAKVPELPEEGMPSSHRSVE